MTKYNIILADPPWAYRDKLNQGERGVEFKYPTMTMKDIKNLPVRDLAADNCCLFLWATMPLLPEAFATMDAWGFKYKTNAFTWIKMNKKQQDTVFWGLGHWTRGNAEICLLGVRGKPKRIDSGVHSVIMSPIGQHSAKPPETRDRIVKLLGDIPRIELFARETAPGWDGIGNHLDGQDIRDSIKNV